MDKLLQILENDCRMSVSQIALMLGISEQETKEEIARLEKEKIILGYKALVDWEKTSREVVTAFIEVKVAPQNGEGFDRVAEKIYKYEEVESVYLMSGGFDLAITIEGKTLKEVAMFVAEKLATIEAVTSTATHFVLKKYKDKKVIFYNGKYDSKRVMNL